MAQLVGARLGGTGRPGGGRRPLVEPGPQLGLLLGELGVREDERVPRRQNRLVLGLQGDGEQAVRWWGGSDGDLGGDVIKIIINPGSVSNVSGNVADIHNNFVITHKREF